MALSRTWSVDDRARPDGVHQRMLVEQLAGPLDEIEQDVEGAWWQRDRLAARSRQHATSSIELEVLESVERRLGWFCRCAFSDEFRRFPPLNKASSASIFAFYAYPNDALIQAEGALLAFGSIVTLGACAGQSIGTMFTTGRHLPPDAIVLAPSEHITLNARTADRREYFCTNGIPLQCDRLSFKLYCHCPAGRGP